MPAESVLVTGAAGFVGRHVARACLAEGYRVVALDCRQPPADLRSAADVQVGSFDDPAILRAVGAGQFSAVIHLAAISSTLEQDWDALRRTNVAGPTELARRCADSGTRFVYASSSSVYGHIAERVPVPESAVGSPLCSGPLNLYARSKALFDEIMLADFAASDFSVSDFAVSDGWPGWAGLRFTNVFGTGERHKQAMASIISQLLHRAARGKPVTLFADTLTACRDYLPVEAVARTCLQLAEGDRPSGVFNLGSGQPISFAELLQWCAEFTGSPLPVNLIPNPYADRYQYWTCADMSALDAVLPDRPRPDASELKAAARALFDRYRRR